MKNLQERLLVPQARYRVAEVPPKRKNIALGVALHRACPDGESVRELAWRLNNEVAVADYRGVVLLRPASDKNFDASCNHTHPQLDSARFGSHTSIPIELGAVELECCRSVNHLIARG